MQPHPTSLQNLQTTLLQEKQAFSELLDLLQQERGVLETDAIDELASFSDRKQTLTRKIEELSLFRSQIIATSQNPSAAVSSVTDTLKTLPESLQKQWQQVLDLAEECHKCNQVNGKIIQLSKSRIDRSLRLLKSQTGDLGLTYNSAGLASLSGNNLRAIKA